MSIFITGSCGFIGYHVSLACLREGFEVVGIDHMQLPDEDLKELRLSHLETFPGFRFLKCDLTDHVLIKKALGLRKIDTVFHFAGQGRGEGEQNVFSYLYHNVTGALNFIEILKEFPIKNIIFPQIGLEKDGSFYQASLLAREVFLQTYCQNSVFKIFKIDIENIFGTYSHKRCDVSDFIEKISKEEVIYLKKHGREMRCYVHIDEITQKIIAFIKYPQDFAPNEGYVVTQIYLIQTLEDLIKKEAQIVWGKEKEGSNLAFPKDISFDDQEFKQKLFSVIDHF